MQDWLAAFLLTEAAEAPIYSFALRGRRPVLRFLLALAASALTHPFVWLLVLAFGDHHYWTAVAAAEALAVAVEAGYLRLLAVPAPARWAIAANGTSFGLGLGAWALGGWR